MHTLVADIHLKVNCCPLPVLASISLHYIQVVVNTAFWVGVEYFTSFLDEGQVKTCFVLYPRFEYLPVGALHIKAHAFTLQYNMEF